jgi:hypothetical protein
MRPERTDRQLGLGRLMAIPLKCFVFIFCVSVSAVGSLAVAVAAASPRSSSIAAAFPPWWANSDIFKAAARAGDPLRIGRFPWIVIVRGDASDLSERLRSAGAIALVDANSLAGCGL